MHKSSAKRRQHQIAVLDAGSQFGGLIDRNVRELGYRTALLPLDTPVEELGTYDAIIISGGPKSVDDEDAYLCDPRLITLDKPILGICYGMHLLAKLHGGTVEANELREDGPQNTVFSGGSLLFDGLAGTQRVLMSHGISVAEVPKGFKTTGKSQKLISAMENPALRQYAVQFHPEVFQTECGTQIFQNFLGKIAGLEPDYSLDDQESEAIRYIQQTVGQHDVVVFVSGGVDSAVLAALIAKAIDKSKVHAFHVDTGFMRHNESQSVIAALQKAGMPVTLLDLASMFYEATTIIDGSQTAPLREVTDPQIKRKIIGDTFVKVRAKILKDYKLSEYSILAQGSLRPDLIESGSHLASSKADIIKTHHNDTEEVRKLRQANRVVEPLQQLYKDQVRALGRRLGLPASLVERHPFPGPGLAIRIICADAPYKLPNHQELQAQLDTFLLDNDYQEYSAQLLPVRTVGVQGDGRSYKYLVGLRGPADWPRLKQLAAIIPNNNHSVNRVVYLFGGSKVEPDKLGVTPTHLSEDVISQVRQADAVVTGVLRKHRLMSAVSQMPVILFPVDFGQSGARAIALRPFKTPDFMTGLAAQPGIDLPEAALSEMVDRILAEVAGISQVALDLSSKPPGTTEWE